MRDSERYVNRELELEITRVIYDSNFYHAGQVVNGITLLTGMTAYIYLPPDCVSVRMFEWFSPAGLNPATNGTDQYTGNATQMLRVAEDILGIYAPNKSIVGAPVYFYISGSQPIYGTGNPSPLTGILCVAPTPDQNYAYRLHYITQQESLVDLGPGQYNYVSTWYPDCLFYACMVRYSEFSKKTEQIQYWTQMLTEALKMGKEEEIRRKGESWKDLSETTEPLAIRNK